MFLVSGKQRVVYIYYFYYYSLLLILVNALCSLRNFENLYLVDVLYTYIRMMRTELGVVQVCTHTKLASVVQLRALFPHYSPCDHMSSDNFHLRHCRLQHTHQSTTESRRVRMNVRVSPSPTNPCPAHT